MKRIYIYGAGGHGLVVASIAKVCGFKEIRFIDDGDNNFPSLKDVINEIKEKNFPVALGIGNNQIRKKIFNNLKWEGINILTLIHPTSIISEDVEIDIGTVIMPNVIINTKAKIGIGVILNSGCIIEHECVIGNFAHISPGVALAGQVKIGELTHIGIGSSVIQNITIGRNCIIGAGSVVVNNIPDNKKAYGVPCKIKEDIKIE